MSERHDSVAVTTSRRIELAAIAATAGLAVLGTTMAVLLWPGITPSSALGMLAGGGLLPVVLAVVGGVVVLRRPANTVGRLVVAAGGLLTPVYLSESVTVWAAATGRPTTGLWAAWVFEWVWAPGVLVVLYLVPLLFPDGRLPSPRWRPLAWAVVVTMVAALLTGMLQPGRLELSPARNPLGIAGTPLLWPVVGVVLPVAMLGCLLLVVGQMVVRYHRAAQVERQQLKVLLFPLAVVVSLLVVAQFVPLLAPILQAGPLLFTVVPVALAIAVLRYGLYEIDRVISRAVSFALLSALVTGVYAGSVVALSRLLGAVGGGSDLAVAGATLAAAAVIGPARGRIQRAVDRRFNRVRYDTVRAVEEFRAGLRQSGAAGVEEVSAALMTAVDGTLSPVRSAVLLVGRR